MLLAWDKMWEQLWHEANTPIEQTELTGNKVSSGTQMTFDSDAFDAFRQGVNWEASRLSVSYGMSAYRLEIPEEAFIAGNKVTDLEFRLSADRYALGGLKVAAFLSDSPTPPRDFNFCRFGGQDFLIDVSGEFSTPDFDFEIPETWEFKAGTSLEPGANIPERIGVLAATEMLVFQNVNKSVIFNLDVSSASKMYKYIHLIVSMFSPAPWRQANYVEGSGFIPWESIQVTTLLDFELGDKRPWKEKYGYRVPLHMAMGEAGGSEASPTITKIPSQFLRYKLPIVSITDKFFGIDWAVKQALINGDGNLFKGAAIAEGAVGSDTTKTIEVARPALAPSVWVHTDGTIQVRKSIAFFSCPLDVPDDLFFLWMNFTNDSFLGRLSMLRLLVYSSDVSSSPASAVWNGTASGLVAMRDMRGDEVVPGWFGLPVKKFNATQRLMMCAALTEVAHEDIHTLNGIVEKVGFVARIGFDLRDAHISRELAPVITGAWSNYIPTPIIDPISPVLTALAITGFTSNGVAAIGNNVDLGEVAYPLDVAFSAQFSGTAFPLQLATGETEFWTLASTPNAQFVSRGVASCIVRFTAPGAFTLNYKARDAMSTPTELLGAVSIQYAGPPIFEIVSAGSISPPGPFTVNEDVTQELVLSGVTVMRNGQPTDNYTITWMESVTNDEGVTWTQWQPAVGDTGDEKFTPQIDTVSTRRYCARITQNESAITQKDTNTVIFEFTASTYYIASTGSIWFPDGTNIYGNNLFMLWDNNPSKEFHVLPDSVSVFRNGITQSNNYYIRWEKRFAYNPAPSQPFPHQAGDTFIPTQWSEWEPFGNNVEKIRMFPKSISAHPWFLDDAGIWLSSGGVGGGPLYVKDFAQIFVEVRYVVVTPTEEKPIYAPVPFTIVMTQNYWFNGNPFINIQEQQP